MAAGQTALEIQQQSLQSKDQHSFSGSRLLSKISRSPTNVSSRKHRTAQSQSSQGSDTLPDLGSNPTSASHSRRNQPRPSIVRLASAPDTSIPIPPLHNLSDDGPRHLSDTTGETASQAKVMLGAHRSHTALSSRPPTAASTATLTVGEKDMSFAPIVSEYTLPGQISNGAQTAAVNYMYQQISETSTKRIATLEYMRKTHEERKTFWFNTVQFTKTDISRIPSYAPNRLARRASNYFLLGLSIPAVLDVHQNPPPNSPAHVSTNTAMEYLRSLHTLLAEFESYQTLHPTDGSHVGSLSRARLPSMFKRTGTTRPRKSSSTPYTDFGAQISPPAVPETPLHHGPSPSIDTTSIAPSTFSSSAPTLVTHTSHSGHSHGGIVSPNFSPAAIFPPPGPPEAPNSSLLPNEAPYTHLLTPPLPFAPDFYTVFTTLCDVLIDTYYKILQLVNGPNVCNATVAELFSKTDARIRKVMVGAIARDFETAAREQVKKEMNGVQKVVLGGLMG